MKQTVLNVLVAFRLNLRKNKLFLGYLAIVFNVFKQFFNKIIVFLNNFLVNFLVLRRFILNYYNIVPINSMLNKLLTINLYKLMF